MAFEFQVIQVRKKASKILFGINNLTGNKSISFVDKDIAIFPGQFCSRGKGAMRITLNPGTCPRILFFFMFRLPNH